MTKGIIKLYRIDPAHAKHGFTDMSKYYNVKERQKIIEYWRRQYCGEFINYFIQIAPGVLSVKRLKRNNICEFL